MRDKSFQELESQYKRLLQQAFPKLKFRGVTWNWYKVYNEEPSSKPNYLRINRAFISTAKKRKHPFYS